MGRGAPTASQPTDARATGSCTLQPPKQLFNLTTLNRVHPAIEIEEYLQRRPAVSQLVRITHHGCEPTHSPEEADFNGLRLTAQSSLCHTAMQHQGSALRSNPAESIAFSNSIDQMQYQVGHRAPAAPEPCAEVADARAASPRQGALRLRPFVRFEQSTYDVASEFVTRTFGSDPFVAIHWRRTDFLLARRTQSGVLQDARQMVAHARRVMEEHSVRQGTGLSHHRERTLPARRRDPVTNTHALPLCRAAVFLASDCDDPEELRVVQSLLAPQRYQAPPVSPASVRPGCAVHCPSTHSLWPWRGCCAGRT